MSDQFFQSIRPENVHPMVSESMTAVSLNICGRVCFIKPAILYMSTQTMTTGLVLGFFFFCHHFRQIDISCARFLKLEPNLASFSAIFEILCTHTYTRVGLSMLTHFLFFLFLLCFQMCYLIGKTTLHNKHPPRPLPCAWHMISR